MQDIEKLYFRTKQDRTGRKLCTYHIQSKPEFLSDQELGLNSLHVLVENSEKVELQILCKQDYPTLLLECLKPGAENCATILDILALLINKCSLSSFSGENPLDIAFGIGIGNFWSIGKWSADTGDSVTLLLWYKVLSDLLASTIVLPDWDSAVEASAVGLKIGYNPDILHAVWSCMIRFCSSERVMECPSLYQSLLYSCSLIGSSQEQNDHCSSLLLHESALFVFLNCLRSVFIHGWSFLGSECRTNLLQTFERDVVQVIFRICI